MKKLIFIEVLLTLCYQDLLSYPWNNNTREHLFGTVEECKKEDCDNYHVWLHDDSSKCEDPDCKLDDHTLYHVDASIQDEGFRWRNSLNFTIDGENISEWKFNPVVKWDERAKDFVLSNTYETIYGADKIHRHLSDIACNIQKFNPKIANVATAAITIVTEEEGKYKATSKIYNINNKVQYAMSKGKSGTYGFAQHILDCISEIRGYSFNSPGSSYQCTEGKIVAALMSNPRFNDFVKKLSVLKEDNIKLIILHIHTIMDPCAVCTRMLTGLSKYINETHGILWSLPSRDFKFLVEVSSNKSYKTTPSDKKLEKQDNFAVWTGDNSHAECAGRDNNENMVIDVKSNINASEEIQLGIPNERSKENWKFARSFPPYIIFHRLCHDYCANKLNAVN